MQVTCGPVKIGHLDNMYSEISILHISIDFTLKSQMAKFKIYEISWFNFTLYLDFVLHLLLTNNIVKSRFDCSSLLKRLFIGTLEVK